MRFFVLLFIVFTLGSYNSVYGQLVNSTSVIEKANSVKLKAEPKYKGVGLRFYKNYLSSQDGSRCRFNPSCSVYAAHQLQIHGLWLGWWAAFDRLLRCTSFSDDEYELNEAGQYIDP